MIHTIDRRLKALERQQARVAAHEPDTTWYEFMVAPSCPPDKMVHIRGGVVTPSGQWGWIIQTDFEPDYTLDFEDGYQTQMTLNFTNAGYFLPLILCYDGNWFNRPEKTDPRFANVVGTEVATAAGAEAQIDAFLNGYTQWYDYRMPLRGIVLKNNGITGIDYQIEAIDAVNRGRSYLYRDARSKGGIIA